MLGSFPERPGEPGIGDSYRRADFLARRVDERGGGFLRLGGLGERVLLQDRGRTERLDARRGSPYRGVGDYRFEEFSDPRLVILRSKVSPARQGRQRKGLQAGELAHPEILAALPGGEFLRAIEPCTFHRLAREQGLDAVGTRPFSRV